MTIGKRRISITMKEAMCILKDRSAMPGGRRMKNRILAFLILISLCVYVVPDTHGLGQSLFQVVQVKKDLALLKGGSTSGLIKGQRLYVKRRAISGYVDVGTAVVLLAEPHRSAVKLVAQDYARSIRVGDLLYNSETDFSAYRARYSAEGFMNMHWGMDIRLLDDFDDLFNTGAQLHGMEIYDKMNDISRIENADIENIQYGFSRNKFAGVIINTRDWMNFDVLKRACTRKFGKSDRIDKMGHMLYWRKEKTVVVLKYNVYSKEGILYIASREVFDQQKAMAVALDTMVEGID